jgi:cation:H+ antiporter
MDAQSVVMMLVGLVLLVAGGEALVRGASGLALAIGLSPLVVGLTVVAFSTSAPELAVALGAVARGEPDLAVGNVVGSNIANVLLILGIAALILPLAVKARVVRVDLPVMVGMSVLFFLLSLDGTLSTLDGVVLFALMLAYTALTLVLGKRRGPDGDSDVDATEGGVGAGGDSAEHAPDRKAPLWLDGLLVAAGVALLVFGANLLVNGAVRIATALGVSGLVIGLTVVAIGTSMPELATAVVAARRGQGDLAVGNVVGSNIFNIGLVLGLPAIISAGGLPVADAAVALDIPLMIAAAVALLPVAFTGFAISRWEGVLFVALYLSYTAYVVLSATEHDALDRYSTIMLSFVLPLVGLTLVVLAVFEARRSRRVGRQVS